MNPDKRDIRLMLEWFRGTKDYEKALKAFEKEKDLRNRRANAMSARAIEWQGLSPREQQAKLATIKKEIEAEVV